MTDDVANAEWSGPENRAWRQIAAGACADFNAELTLDPRAGDGWDADRTLSSGFLRAILLDREWRDQLPIEGVRISGARWTGELALRNAHLQRPLCLENCRFEGPVRLAGLRSESRLSLRGSALEAGLDGAGVAIQDVFDMTSARIEGKLDLERIMARCLFMGDLVAEDVTLANGEIVCDVDFGGAQIAGPLRLNDVRIGQDLALDASTTAGASFNEIALIGAYAGGNVSLIGATVRGPVKMNSLEVGKSLFLRAPVPDDDDYRPGRTRFRDKVDVSNARIDGYVELLGARFGGPVNLTEIQIGENLSGWGEAGLPTIYHGPVTLISVRIKGSADFSGARFRDEVNWTAAQVERNLFLNGPALFKKKLDLSDARITGNLFMNDLAGGAPKCRGEVKLQNAMVEGQVEFTAHCEGSMNCSGLQVGLNLFMRRKAIDGQVSRPVFKEVDLSYADVKGMLDLDGATFGASLNLRSVKVGQDLRLAAAITGDVTLTRGDVGGDLLLDTTTEGNAYLRALHVGGNAEITGRFGGQVDLSRTRVDRVLNTAGAHWGKILDLSAATVTGHLYLRLPERLPEHPADGATPIQLDLRDARIGHLQLFAPEARALEWPGKGSIQLDGFTYERLGGSGVAETDEMLRRGRDWYVDLLGLDEPYSPQPYEHLAAVLRQAGETEKSNAILFASRERVRADAWSSGAYVHWLGLSLLNWTIGYGIGNGYFRALLCVIGFTVAGVLMLGLDVVLDGPKGAPLSMLEKAAYSFDQLLPIIELDPAFSDIQLSDRVTHYFYLHRTLGFLLGSFIAAGVAGLTQRSRS